MKKYINKIYFYSIMKREDIITQLMEQGLSRIEAEMQLAHFNVHNDTAQAMYEACNCEAI